MLDQLIKELKIDEGKRSRPYKDSVGVLTIGYGHNLSAEGLCDEALEVQLRYDVNKVLTQLDRYLPWWRKQPEVVQRVMANLGFNLGVGGLLQFKRTLRLIQEGDYKGAADALLLSKYARQVGLRAIRLANLLRGVV